MQVPAAENVAWNGRYADWGDSAWKSDGPVNGMAMGGWYDHPSDAESTLQSFDTYTNWQAQNGNNVFGDCSQQLMYGSSEHHNDQGSIWGAAGGGGLVNPSNSQFGQATNPWSTTPASRDNQHPSAYGGNGFNHMPMPANDMGQPQVGMFSSSSTGPHMMSNNGASCQPGGPGSDLSTQAASSDASRYEAASQGTSSKLRGDDSDEEEDRTPKEATQEEKDEAEEVVRLAFKEAKERKKLREKVKGASPADLQALLNARFAKKS